MAIPIRLGLDLGRCLLRVLVAQRRAPIWIARTNISVNPTGTGSVTSHSGARSPASWCWAYGSASTSQANAPTSPR